MKCNGEYRNGTMRWAEYYLVVMSLGLVLGSVCKAAAAVDVENALPLEEAVSRPLGESGRIPESERSAVAEIEVLFMQRKGEGIVSLLSPSIGIAPEYSTIKGTSAKELQTIRRNERQHEAFGTMVLVGVDTPNGRVGVSFNVVPKDYTGTGWGVLIAGERYRIRMQSPVVAEVWLHVPRDIVPGKTYVARWLVAPQEEREDREVSKLPSSYIQGTVAPSLLSESTGLISAFYRDLKTGIEIEKVIDESGLFSIAGSLRTGNLTLYTQYGNSAAALCTIEGTDKRQIILPDDATKVYHGSEFVSGELCVGKNFQVTKESLLVAVYASKDSQIPLCFRYSDAKRFLLKGSTEADGEKATVMSFAFLPGEYDARFYQYGREIGAPSDQSVFGIYQHGSSEQSVSGRKLLAQMSIQLTKEAVSNTFLFNP